MFTNQTAYSTGANSIPYGVAVGDVNSDNKPDIIVANYGANNIGVLLNRGNGTFSNQTTYSTGGSSTPNNVAVVDVNSDNKPDIIVANYGTNNVGIFFNLGNGTFSTQTTYSTGSGSTPCSVAVADVDSDNKPDIIVANSGANNVGVLLSLGNGTFYNQTIYPLAGSLRPAGVTVADVNNDNKFDIIVANAWTQQVGVLLNLGNGTFSTQKTYSTGVGSGTPSVTVADVNSDNKLDIIVANFGTNNVGVFLNFGNGTFANQTTYPTGTNANSNSVAVTDANNDNKPDIIVANFNGHNVGVFLNSGTGTFSNQTTYSTGGGSNPHSVVVTDVNSDNQPDIIVANSGLDNVGVLLHC